MVAVAVAGSLAGAACSDTVANETGSGGGTLPAPASTADPESTTGSAPTADASSAADPITTTDPAATDPAPTDSASAGPASTNRANTDPAETADDEPASNSSDAPDGTLTTPSTSMPTRDIAVVYAAGGGFEVAWTPLGWWDGAAWRDELYEEDTLDWIGPPAPTVGALAATSLDLPDGDAQVITGLTAGPLDFYCVGDEQGPVFELGIDLPETPASNGYDVVAVTADWPLQPRAVRQVGLDSPSYAEVGATLMAEQTPTAADGDVVQVVRADLDGDGTEEVLVAYERQTSTGFGADGDFSAVYARYPSADGSVADELVFSYVSEEPVDFPTPGRATVAAVADFNGDGVMEVVVRSTFWESADAEVYALRDGRLTRVAGNGCGV